MNTTRRGKIAKLPGEIREQFNRRLDAGEEGAPLADWLNGLPEVRTMLAASFEGQPISESNISHWKQGGGFEDWRAQQEALTRVDRIIEDAAQIEGAKAGLLGDRLAVWVISRLILAAGTLGREDAEEKDWKLLRELSQNVAELRRGDRAVGWLQLERERRADEREERERRPEQQFWKWAEVPEVRDAICRGHLTHEEKLALMIKVMFGNIDERIRRGGHWRPIPGATMPEPDRNSLPPDVS
jgi:hypothetical protein